MTIAPEAPRLLPIEGNEAYRRLVEDHLTYIRVGFGYSLRVLIKAGYETDGASIPSQLMADDIYGEKFLHIIESYYSAISTRWDLIKQVKQIVGNPWDMPRILAAIVHDALYGRKWKCRWMCDMIYRRILATFGYNKMMTAVEYAGIRLIGWRNWGKITSHELETTKLLTEVNFVRNRKVVDGIAQLTKSNR